MSATRTSVIKGSLTPGWVHDVRIDIPVVFSVVPSTWIDVSWKDAIDLKYTTNQAPATINRTAVPIFEPAHGWRAMSYVDFLSTTYELAASDSAVRAMTYPAATARGSIMAAFNNQRAITSAELACMGTNSARATGDPFNRKTYAAADPDPIVHATDQSTFPGPNVSAVTNLDRLAYSNVDTNPEEQLTFRFKFPKVPSSQSAGPILNFYFCGVPSWPAHDAYEGTGFYCITLQGDGQCVLWEKQKTSNAWINRKTSFWALPSQVSGREHYITIKSDATDDGAGVYSATTISILCSTSAGDIGGSDTIPTGNNASRGWNNNFSYAIPRKQPTSGAQTTCKIRVDCRRDIMLAFYIADIKYYPSSSMWTSMFTLTAPPLNVGVNVSDIQIGFFGAFPTGTTTTVDLYWVDPATNALTACTPHGSLATNATYIQQNFYAVEGKQLYRAKVTTNTSSSGFKTPRVTRFTAVRNPVYKVSTPTFVSHEAANISITGQGRDPSTASCYMKIINPSGSLSRLQTRGRIPFDVKLYYDSTDRTKYSIIFRGRIMEAKFTKDFPPGFVGSGQAVVGTNNSARLFPASNTGHYTCRCLGEFASIQRRQAPKTYNFAVDPNASPPRPYLVSDVIRILLYASGYDTQQVDVPNYTDTYLLTQQGGDEYRLEVYSRTYPYMAWLAGQFLNAWLVFDENAQNGGTPSDLGCWRLKRAPKPNGSGKYRALAAFKSGQSDSADHGGSSIPTVLPGAFPLVSDGINTTPTLRPRAILKEFYETLVEPPEGNMVKVTGVGTVSTGGITSVSTKYALQQQAVNWKACDYGQNGTDHPLPDATYPDYTDGVPDIIYICDPALTTQDAVDWRCRRTYDLACHAKYWTIFAAPMVLVTDPDDTLQLRPRPLHFGDIVLIDGVQNVVNACHFQADMGDGSNAATFQNTIAIYECFQVPALTQAYDPSGSNQMYRTICSQPA